MMPTTRFTINMPVRHLELGKIGIVKNVTPKDCQRPALRRTSHLSTKSGGFVQMLNVQVEDCDIWWQLDKVEPVVQEQTAIAPELPVQSTPVPEPVVPTLVPIIP